MFSIIINKNDLHMKTRILIMTLLVLLIGSTAFCQVSYYGSAQKTSNTTQNGSDDDKVYEDTIGGHEPPHMYGGMKALANYLRENMQYPVVAQENGVEGRVLVSFVVGLDGHITDIKLERSVDPSLDREALRLVRGMPRRWIPGKENGVPVRVRYTLPIVFRLK